MKLHIPFLISLMTLVLASQYVTAQDTLQSTQKALKTILIDKAPAVVSLKFDGCKMFVKAGAARRPQSIPTAATPASPNTFPRSDASVYLSTGGDYDPSDPGPMETIQFDLSAIGEYDVSIRPSVKGKYSFLGIDGVNSGSISVKSDDGLSSIPSYSLRIVSTSIEQAVTAFRNAITACRVK